MRDYVVSLSSIPARFDHLEPALHSILAQSEPPRKVILYIPECYRRFPDWDGQLPDVPKPVEIRRVKEDLGPATKVLPAARDFRNEDVDLIFGDDDNRYPVHWAERLRAASRRLPRHVICYRGLEVDYLTGYEPVYDRLPRAVPNADRFKNGYKLRYGLRKLWSKLTGARTYEPGQLRFSSSGYCASFEGVGGVLVRPDWFDDGDWDIPEELRYSDDLWLSGKLVSRGIPIWVEAGLVLPEQGELKYVEGLHTRDFNGRSLHPRNRYATEYMQREFKVWPIASPPRKKESDFKWSGQLF